jgi:predicted anti-sigma-YlaC factor YlaD
MSTTPSSRPRFVCRVVRRWYAVLGAPQPGPAGRGRSRHIETCADCRQFFRAGDELESALRRDAVRYAPVPPAGIERRIMQAIDRSTRTARPARSPRALILAGSAVAAVALIAFFVKYPAFPERDGTEKNRTAQVSDALVVAQSISTLWQNSVVPSAQTLVADNPLQHELDSVYSDTRTALNFLALNFLPTNPATPSLQSAGADAIRQS